MSIVEVTKEVATEVYRLNGRISEMETALKVIHTWASFDMDKGHNYPMSFELKHVVKLCDKALKGKA